ncbi:hypothetical protein HN51_058526 [Arachis hypogaea]
MALAFTIMTLNLVLRMAMVATNILSLYHLSSTLQSPKSPKPPTPIPDQLLHQLHTIRASINHLTRLQHSTDTTTTSSTIPPDLLLHSHLNPIASSCDNHPDLLHKYMSYTPFSLCPSDSDLAESLILYPFPSSLPDSSVIWDHYPCKSFDCFHRQNPNLGFNPSSDSSKFITYKTDLDLPISQLFQIAKSAKSVIWLGLDVGGGTGSFAATMKLRNVTVVMTMSVGAPYSEAVALRGLVSLHVSLQQRLPVFDGVVDLVRYGRAVNRWISVTMMKFLLFDVDRVLRGGGYLWIDRFFSKGVDLEKLYAPLIEKLGCKKVKWATGNKADASGIKNAEVFLTALLQKPTSR